VDPDLLFSGNLGVCPSLPFSRSGKWWLRRTLLVLHHYRHMLWLRCRFPGGDGEHGAHKRWAVPLGFRVRAAILSEDPIVRVWLDVDAGMAGVCGQQCLCLWDADPGYGECAATGQRDGFLADHVYYVRHYCDHDRLQYLGCEGATGAGDCELGGAYRLFLRRHDTTSGTVSEEQRVRRLCTLRGKRRLESGSGVFGLTGHYHLLQPWVGFGRPYLGRGRGRVARRSSLHVLVVHLQHGNWHCHVDCHAFLHWSFGGCGKYKS
jgi:hypothetical protein